MILHDLLWLWGGLVLGCLATLSLAPKTGKGASTDLPDSGDTDVPISPEVQAILDKLAPIPAAIKTAIANAEGDAAAALQNHADEVAALTAAVDPIVAAVTPPAE